MKKEEIKKLRKTLVITFLVCLIVIVLVTSIQLYGQNKIVASCSYLDPITIDILAFIAALFLFLEGFARIIEHPGASLKRQATRIIRIAFGCAILTLHIIQFLHK
jgi:predicted histidine transporter YuiF (NhaC family)